MRKRFVFEGIGDVRVFDEIRKFIAVNGFPVGFKMHDDFSEWSKYLPNTDLEGFVDSIRELVECHNTLEDGTKKILLHGVNGKTPYSWAQEAMEELDDRYGSYETEDLVMTFVNQAIRSVTAGHAAKYSIGDRVWHAQYGIGTVDSYIEHDNSALNVVFGDEGAPEKENRTVCVAYLRLSCGRECLHRTSLFNPRFATFSLGDNFYNLVGKHLEMYAPVEGEDGIEYDVVHIDLDVLNTDERAALQRALGI